MNRAIAGLVLVLAAVGPAAFALADDVPPAPVVPVPPTHDPDAVKYLQGLADKIDKQVAEEAIPTVKTLVNYWQDPAVKAETKAPIPGLVARYGKRKEAPVALAAVKGLEEIGKSEGSKNLLVVLDALLDRSDFDGDVTKAVFASLKRLADPDEAVVKALLKLFHYKDDAVVAKAVEAIGGYGAAPFELRKSLFEEVLKSFEGVESESHRPTNKAAFNRWSVVSGSVMPAVTALGHQSFTDLAAARQWFNDHSKDADAWK